MPAELRAAAVTLDAVLGGRLHLRQPRQGHRFGHDAILLAAACPARPREHAVDLGAGVGAAGLALAARVPGAAVTLVELDPELAALAASNAEANAFGDRVKVVVLDVTKPAGAFSEAGLSAETADHVLMNPPFNDPARTQSSPGRQRRLAHMAAAGTLDTWIAAAARLLRPHGTLTLIWRADGLDNVFAALARGFGTLTVLPVHAKPDAPAVRVLVRATKATRAPLALLPPLCLSDGHGHPTPEAEAVLRAGAPLMPSANAYSPFEASHVENSYGA
jgi:tRNA1(Val) A37 N6-methylase TrmN6